MERFVGSISSDDKVLLENIEGSLHIYISESGWKSWKGSFELPAEKNLGLGDKYLLELKDGRKGNFFVKHQQITSFGTNNIEFQGTGPLA